MVENGFTFNISLSVLNHLGRNLYRNFITILGEAISNARDADANNVWIEIDQKQNFFVVKDDGVGMSEQEFQDKFLKIGYSKRRESSQSLKERPYIGRKGIGKLALLSCAEKISIISKKDSTKYIGGMIDNHGLTQAIQDDMNPENYPLQSINDELFSKYKQNHTHGTIIYFEELKDGIKNTIPYLKKLIALYFRFSLIDNDFSIYLNDEKISYEDLKDLSDKTEFLREINDTFSDPYVEGLKQKENSIPLKEQRKITNTAEIKGFIASVETPRDLSVMGTGERVNIDLFVNGRLRERNILRHIPMSRIVENYLYGQIHFNELDYEEEDAFTSSREEVVADNAKFQTLLANLQTIIRGVANDWDEWRVKNREDGDVENTAKITKKERKSKELVNATVDEYIPSKDSPSYSDIEQRISQLTDDAQFNVLSYNECFISENLLRKYIQHKAILLSNEANAEVERMRNKETSNKDTANLSIEIRSNVSDLSYLDMDHLANLIDKPQDPNKQPGVARDAKEYKPIRDALAHTALLTIDAKQKLTTVYNNIKARIKILLIDINQ